MSSFFQLTLRTLDVAAARAFYLRVLGEPQLDVVRLHEQAIARGARPHWLGFIDVSDVDAALSAFVARGAVPLGPKWVNPAGLEAAVIRDAGGAVVALARPPAPVGPMQTRVVWHVLHTEDVEHAKASYGALCGWHFHDPVALSGFGPLHPFSYTREGAPVGVMHDIAATPGIHPHWLFHFEVAQLEPALDEVRAGGGSFLPPVKARSSSARERTMAAPGGATVAVCDDPQGAAFALLARDD